MYAPTVAKRAHAKDYRKGDGRGRYQEIRGIREISQ
jgi:hypothetical protein